MALFFQENKANHDSKELRLEDRDYGRPSDRKIYSQSQPSLFWKDVDPIGNRAVVQAVYGRSGLLKRRCKNVRHSDVGIHCLQYMLHVRFDAGLGLPLEASAELGSACKLSEPKHGCKIAFICILLYAKAERYVHTLSRCFSM
jgi:hypothetical protein